MTFTFTGTDNAWSSHTQGNWPAHHFSYKCYGRKIRALRRLFVCAFAIIILCELHRRFLGIECVMFLQKFGAQAFTSNYQAERILAVLLLRLIFGIWWREEPLKCEFLELIAGPSICDRAAGVDS
jgi:hypothetical protein